MADNGGQADNPAEDAGIYIICYMCDSLERWDRHKASSEPVLVTQKRTEDTETFECKEYYCRLTNSERPFARMIESAISKGFGRTGVKKWLPHVVLVAGAPDSANHNPLEVDPQSTPLKMDLRPNSA